MHRLEGAIYSLFTLGQLFDVVIEQINLSFLSFCLFFTLISLAIKYLLFHILGALLNQMRTVLFNQVAGIIYHTFEQMEKHQKVFVISDGAVVRILHLEQLSSNISKCLDISSDCSNSFVHKNDLVKHLILLSLFH